MRNADPTKGGAVITEKLMQTQADEKTEFDKRKFFRDKRETEFKSYFKNIDDGLLS